MTADVLDRDDLAEELEEETSADAPWGINPKTKKPYKYPPEVRAANAARMTAARWGGVPKAPGKTSSRKPAAKTARPDYRTGVLGLCQIPAFALGVAAKFTKNHALALDSATITLHAPSVADALAETAEQQTWLANILDKALEVGPYGALLGAFVPLAFQLAANHGKVAANPELGILDEEGLAAALAERAKGSP